MPEKTKYTSKRSVRQLRKDIAPLLNSWHDDPEEAQGAMVAFLPQGTTLSDAVHSVIKKKIPPYMMVIFTLREHWKEIAGEVAAKRTLPVRYKEGILDVEVSHPGYRMALSGKTIQNAILEKVRMYPGAEDCKQLRFIPAGSLNREF
ncbi:MAG: DUF721 domain-containing protein [Lentisphaeria bacterium]|nr:DUF721 domain-containing protein [Lentisphaeria bacterium]